MSTTCVGTFLNADDTPASGVVTFTPDISAVDTDVPAVITQYPLPGLLDDDGYFSVAMMASDDPAWSPSPIPYIIQVHVTGIEPHAFMAYVNGPGPVDITDLVPLSEAPVFPTVDPADYQLRVEKDQPSGYVGLDALGAIHNPILSGVVGMPTLAVNTAGDYGASCDYVIGEAEFIVGEHATGPLHPFVPQFAYAKAVDVLDIPDTWTEVNRLGTDVVAGTYMFGLSLTWAFDVTNRSALFRFSTDNGQTWGHEYTIEPSDAQDRVPFLYQYPIEYGSAQPVGMILQCAKEDASGTLAVTFCDLYLQRVA